MKTYNTLISADIIRDGGSLEVIFRLKDGTFESLWLSVLPWDTPAQIAYGSLKISHSADGAEDGSIVPKGSVDESDIIQGLHDFLERPHVDVPFAHRTDDQHFLVRVTQLLEQIPKRNEK